MYLTHVLSLGVKYMCSFYMLNMCKQFLTHMDIFPLHDVNENNTIAVGKHVLGRYRFHY